MGIQLFPNPSIINNMQLENKVAQQLIGQGKTLAVAESCTGGLLTHRLTNFSGSSAFLYASIVCYSNRAKTDILKIPPSIIRKHGAVSAPVAKLMARHVRKLFDTDLGVAITGIAGPTGGTPQKPVGTVFLAVCDRKQVLLEHHVFLGSRIKVKGQATDRSLELLLRLLIT